MSTDLSDLHFPKHIISKSLCVFKIKNPRLEKAGFFLFGGAFWRDRENAGLSMYLGKLLLNLHNLIRTSSQGTDTAFIQFING